MRKALVVLLLLVGPAAFGAEADPVRALRRALAARDPAGLAAAAAADESKSAFRNGLKPGELAALARLAAEHEPARELLRRAAPASERSGDFEIFETVDEARERFAGADRAAAMAAFVVGRDPIQGPAAAVELARLGDPRGLAALRDAFELETDRMRRLRYERDFLALAEGYPAARGRAAAELWLDLAEAAFAGRLPRGEAGVAFVPVEAGVEAEFAEGWRIAFREAEAAARKALERSPDFVAARAVLLRVDAARRLVEHGLSKARPDAVSMGAVGQESAPDAAALALALRTARERGESEIRTRLLAMADGVTPSRAVLAEIAMSFPDSDPFVRAAAAEAARETDFAAVLGEEALGDEELRALLSGRFGADPEVAEAAARILRSAPLTDAQRIHVLRAEPMSTAGSGVAPAPEAPRKPTLVTVFYGTDREVFRPGFGFYAMLFLPAAIVLALALLLPPALRFVLHPRFAFVAKLVRYGGIVAVLLLAVFAGYGAMRVMKRQDRLGFDYGGGRGPYDKPDGPYCDLGTVTVGIPPNHEIGEVERPGLLSGEPWEDPEKHVMILQIEPTGRAKWFKDLEERGRERAFVFVHGYNVSFEDAALRTAQIAHDLDFEGAPIFFSWPSRASVVAYTVDESSVAWATKHLKLFLADVRRALPESTIHLVAHSMGNRALTEALRRLQHEIEAEELPKFQEVVLAAPDIDAQTFREDIAPEILGTAERITLYASSYDQALAASRQVHGYPRAGDCVDGVLVVDGVQTVEVAVPGKDVLGHSYIGNDGHVLEDLVALLLHRRHPEKRGLSPLGLIPTVWWRLQEPR